MSFTDQADEFCQRTDVLRREIEAQFVALITQERGSIRLADIGTQYTANYFPVRELLLGEVQGQIVAVFMTDDGPEITANVPLGDLLLAFRNTAQALAARTRISSGVGLS